VHLKDMAELATKHPDVARKFREGHFTVQKTQRVFSSIPIDQAHEQNNACIKGDGGAVGLTDNPSALRRWMVAGPEVARVIEQFQDGNQHWRRQTADTLVSCKCKKGCVRLCKCKKAALQCTALCVCEGDCT